MSAFLGPIHHKMYQKICAQSRLAFAIAKFGDTNGWTQDAEQTLHHQFPLLQGALEDLIDPLNIHGWLSQQVAHAEARLAAAVQEAVKQDEQKAEQLLAFVAEDGRNQAALHSAPCSDCTALWQAMDLFWVDGMPCDRCVQVASREDGSIDWSIESATHTNGWSDDCAISYAQLRWTWVEAFAQRQGFKAQQNNPLSFYLSQEV